MKKKRDSLTHYQQRLLKENLSMILRDHKFDSERNITKAYKNIIELTNEKVTIGDFRDIVMGSNDPDQISEAVFFMLLKPKRRSSLIDARHPSETRSGNYAGRKKGDIWDHLQTAFNILTSSGNQNSAEWDKCGISDRDEWAKLFYQVKKSCKKQESYQEMCDHISASTDAILKMIDAQISLWTVIEDHKKKIDTESKKNSPDSKMFLNAVMKIWGNNAPLLHDFFRSYSPPKVGKRVSSLTISKRTAQVLEILNGVKKISELSGTFHSRDFPVALSKIAHLIYFLLFPEFFYRIGGVHGRIMPTPNKLL